MAEIIRKHATTPEDPAEQQLSAAASSNADTGEKVAAESSSPGHVERISVRKLVEFVLRSGDIDSGSMRAMDVEAAREGARIHRKLQKSRKGPYAAEVALSEDINYDELTIRVEGRADGILDGDPTVIEEIKGMYLDVELLEEPFPLHLAQAKCYAAIYAAEQGLTRITVRITCVNLENEHVRFFDEEYESEELKKWFKGVVDLYYKWAKWQHEHIVSRDLSCEKLTFPFPYREGQKKLVAAVWSTITKGQELFLMAPTGVGKTMSCVYPSVRALAAGVGERIFYMTAKNETLAAGREAFRILGDRGLDARTVQITSKEKICPYDTPSCNPRDCRYAKGHYDRVGDAVFELLNEERFIDREVIRRQAEKHCVCPFEMTLDVSSWCDAILCDYNYCFDPDAQLKRFFGNGVKGEYIFLVDEAHNLVDRAREMYSAEIIKEHVLAAKRAAAAKAPKVAKACERVNKLLLAMKHMLEDDADIVAAEERGRTFRFAEIDPLNRAMFSLYTELQTLFQKSEDAALKEALLDFYFEVRSYVGTADYLDDHYYAYAWIDEENHLHLKLFCVDPSARLQSSFDRGRAGVLFSATLLPIDYYKKLLSTREEAQAVYAESPFDTRNRLLLLGRDVSTSFRERSNVTYEVIAAYLAEIVRGKNGNYMAFFPSYQFMRKVFECYRRRFDREGVNWIVQSQGMGDEDRAIFLENFYEDPKESLLAFCVMGGVFAEGIDLVGTRLIGSIVVGTGIPQVSVEREVVKRFFDRDGQGFDFAYRYPGMNKVEQAAGRVIRTATDRGVMVLLDYRFLYGEYRRLFPREWAERAVCELRSVGGFLEKFWSGDERI